MCVNTKQVYLKGEDGGNELFSKSFQNPCVEHPLTILNNFIHPPPFPQQKKVFLWKINVFHFHSLYEQTQMFTGRLVVIFGHFPGGGE